jgi:hypothetical protein
MPALRNVPQILAIARHDVNLFRPGMSGLVACFPGKSFNPDCGRKPEFKSNA